MLLNARAAAVLFLGLLAAPRHASAQLSSCARPQDCATAFSLCVDHACREACTGDSDCDPASDCIEGICLPRCSADADCGAGLGCVGGGCLPVTAVTFPTDYGLADGAHQPGCWTDADCLPVLSCAAGVCQMLNGTAPPTPLSCRDGTRTFNELCPKFGGYACAANGLCQGPSCTTTAGCTAAYPISGLSCLHGRCTSPCTVDSDCCASGTTCGPRAQTTCFPTPGGLTAGVCAANVSSGRLVSYRVAEADPSKASLNIVFVSEGYTSLTDAKMRAFETQALRMMRFVGSHADITNAVFSARHNVFLLELPDSATGFGNPTLFGRFKDALGGIAEQPGAREQGDLAVKTALRAFASAGGFSPRHTAVAAKGVFLFNTTDTGARAVGGPYIVMPVDPGDVPQLSVPAGRFDRYYVFQHELGHFLAAILDEYDSDSNSPTKPAPAVCANNVVNRAAVTACTTCDGTDDAPLTPGGPLFTPAGAAWGEFVNTASFPTTSASLSTVGLYEGANRFFKKESLRSQSDCVMRQQTGRPHFCPACREALMRERIPDGSAQTFRFHDLGRTPVPGPAGDGPLRALAVSSSQHRAFLTGETVNGPALTVLDGDLLTPDGQSEHFTPLGGAGTPRAIVIDEAGGRLFLEGVDVSAPAASRLLVFDTNANQFAPAVSVPHLVGLPAIAEAARRLYAYRERPSGSAFVGELVTVPLDASPLAAQFTVPTGRGALPRFDRAGLLAPRHGLLFFAATKRTPSDAFCDFSKCELWALDPATSQFLDAASVRVTTTLAATRPGIAAVAIGQQDNPAASLGGELLLAATDEQVFVWDVAQVKQGTVTPAAAWPHSMGANTFVTAIAYVPQGERVLVGNNNGDLALFPVRGGARTLFRPSLHRPGMQVRDVLVTADGAGYVGLGGFFPNPRRGVIAVLDLATPSAGGQVVFEQAVASVGLSGPTVAIDEARGVVYTNAVVDTGDRVEPVPSYIRTPLIRGLRQKRFRGSGCP